MPKLKSLRGAIGSYGRVKSGGIIDVDEASVRKHLATKRFVIATEEDIAKAKAAQEAALAVQTTGAAPGFSPMPEKPKAVDRLQEMVERGDLTPSEARKFVGVQIDLSSEEIQAAVRRETEKLMADVEAAKASLAARDQDLDKRAEELKERDQALDQRAGDLDAREKAMVQAEDAAREAAAKAAANAKAKADAEAKAAKGSK